MSALYLITGGAGFIGSHIAEQLTAAGHRVRIFDDLSSGYQKNIAHLPADQVEFIQGDIRDTDALAAAMTGVTYLFHEAALVSVFDSVERPADNHAINITGTLNVCLAARDAGVQRILFAGSAAAYGNNPALPKREDMLPEPESPYAYAKIAGEHTLQVFAKLYGIQTVILRYFNVYGPRQDPSSMYSGVISKFSEIIAGGGTPIIFGDGLQTRDFVYVKDIARANILAMHAPRVGHGEIINIATNRAISLLDLVDTLAGLVDRQVRPEFREARSGDVQHSLADISKAAALLDYAPQYTLEQGLGELLDSLT